MWKRTGSWILHVFKCIICVTARFCSWYSSLHLVQNSSMHCPSLTHGQTITFRRHLTSLVILSAGFSHNIALLKTAISKNSNWLSAPNSSFSLLKLFLLNQNSPSWGTLRRIFLVSTILGLFTSLIVISHQLIFFSFKQAFLQLFLFS